MTRPIPDEARRLHAEGRAAGSAGDAARALSLFQRAHDLAPDWPYPTYDAAFTYLLAGDLEQAEACYAAVDALAPRGFFTTKTSLYAIRRERSGALPEGFAQSYAVLEWSAPDERRSVLAQITSAFPDFAPAWKDVAALLEDDRDKLRAYDRGLACDPDATTRGVILVNKALVLERLGDRAGALALVREVVRDPASTLEAEALAKQLLNGWTSSDG